MKNELNPFLLDLLKCGARSLIIDFNSNIEKLQKSLEILPERCSPVILSQIHFIEIEISMLNDFIENY